MKKLYTLLGTLFFISSASIAQVTSNCNLIFNDTLAYVDSKSSSVIGISVNDINDAFFANHGYAGFAQRYEAPDTVVVKGFCFYGVMDSGGIGTAVVSMYDNDGGGGAPGTVLASETISVPYFGSGYTGPMNDESIRLCVDFTSPVVWEGDYYVAVENLTSTDMYIARNTDGDGAAEALNFTYYKGVSDPTYDGWYDMYNDFGPTDWNFDLIIDPIIEYSLESSLSYDDEFCIDDTLKVWSQISFDDTILANKFYNPNSSLYLPGDLNRTFDFGDLTGVTADTFHLYGAGGTYNVSGGLSLNGNTWNTNIVDFTCDFSVVVNDPSFTLGNDVFLCSQDTAILEGPLNYDSYLWTYGSTNDSLVLASDTMANGVNEYVLEAGLNGCLGSDTILVEVGSIVVDLGNDTTLCLNQSVVLSPGVYDSYDWNTGQLTSSVQIGPFTGTTVENVSVVVTQGGCEASDMIQITVDNCLGVEGLSEENVKVYPNPTSGWVDIIMPSNMMGYEISVIDQLGRVVWVNSGAIGGRLNLTHLENGMYQIAIKSGSQQIVKKIQIIH